MRDHEHIGEECCRDQKREKADFPLLENDRSEPPEGKSYDEDNRGQEECDYVAHSVHGEDQILDHIGEARECIASSEEDRVDVVDGLELHPDEELYKERDRGQNAHNDFCTRTNFTS